MKLWRKKKQIANLTVGLKAHLCKECEEMGRRACVVDGSPAYFHRWIDEDKALLHFNTYGYLMNDDEMRKMSYRFQQDFAIPHGCSAEVVRHTYALVEYADGSVRKVAPELVTFVAKKEAKQ